MSRIAVTGASGSLGGQVVRLLAEHTDGDVVALSRRPTAVPPRVTARIADYADGGALRNGLPDVDSPFCYAVTNGLTEQAIRDSGCGFSIVRASIFAEFFRHFLLPARTTGQLSVPAGDGRIGLVSKGDVGRCLAALARCGPTGRCHELTGPAALDAAAIAATAAQAWVRPVAYRPISAAAYMAQAAATEDPWWLYAYTSMFASIREQRWDRVTAEVQHLTGRDPRHLGEILDETTPSADAR